MAFALSSVVALVSVGCTASGTETRQVASFETTTCPPEVSVVSVASISCGYVTVPEDRSEPDGRTVRIFVFRFAASPPSGPPVLYVGSEIG
ncbi:MAG: hypothetical protein M3O29_05550, partial [Actinomycetota bacterium]|nr:hypothetical protein [Actinomycetota bacterium]